MALTKTNITVHEWATVAAGAVVRSSVFNNEGNYGGSIDIQSFLDSNTAHIGTEFIIQISGATVGDENWQDLTRFVAPLYLCQIRRTRDG